MRLTRYTDYAMRVLLYLGAQPDKVCSIGAIARAYGMSQNHLMKVARALGKAGCVEGAVARVAFAWPGRPTRSMSPPWCAARRKALNWSIACSTATRWRIF